MNRIIDGAKEAVEVAKGDKPAARIHVNGHAYVPADALERLQSERDELAGQVERLKDAVFVHGRKTASLRMIVNELHDVVSDSDGVAGWHRNGDVADWGEFELLNLEALEAALTDTASTAQSERARIRREALEEAANFVEEHVLANTPDGTKLIRDTSKHKGVDRTRVADAIRSLAEEEG